MANKTPVTVSADGKTHEPLGVADTLAPSSLLLNPAADNLTALPVGGIYSKLNTATSDTVTLSGTGVATSPIKADVKLINSTANIISSSVNGLYAQQYVDNSNTITATGFGTAASHISYAVRTDPVATNILTASGTGLAAIVTKANSVTASLSGNGTAASPLTAQAKISTAPYNRLFSDTTGDGLFVDPVVYNPAYVSSIRPGATATVTPAFNARYNMEYVYLYAQGTTFTLNLTSVPVAITNILGYRIRVVMPYDGAAGFNFLKFTTASGSIHDPHGNWVSNANYIYPYSSGPSYQTVIDIVYNAGSGWAIEEVNPATSPIMAFKNTLALGSGTGTCTIDMSAKPYYMISSDWAMRTSLICTPTTTHTRTLNLTLGTATIYVGTLSFVANQPIVVPSPTFIAAPSQSGGLTVLPTMSAVFGTGTGNVTVNAKVICERLMKGSVQADTL